MSSLRGQGPSPCSVSQVLHLRLGRGCLTMPPEYQRHPPELRAGPDSEGACLGNLSACLANWPRRMATDGTLAPIHGRRCSPEGTFGDGEYHLHSELRLALIVPESHHRPGLSQRMALSHGRQTVSRSVPGHTALLASAVTRSEYPHRGRGSGK